MRERVHILAAHLVAAEDISATATHVFPMSCMNSIDSVIRRYDNRLQFARQGQSSQSTFMRQMSNKQPSFKNEAESGIIRRRDNRLQFARQGSCYQGAFMRPMSDKKGSNSQPAMPQESPNLSNNTSAASEIPSRPSSIIEPNIQNVGELRSLEQCCRYNDEVLRSPNFTKPRQTIEDPQSQTGKSAPAMESSGNLRSPRMDVTESGHSYVVAVELPGVDIDGLKVEVSDTNLIVSGNRPAHWSKSRNLPNESISVFHRREIAQGPYRIVWSLPAIADKDKVSAELSEGLLRIEVPKLSGGKTPLRANI